MPRCMSKLGYLKSVDLCTRHYVLSIVIRFFLFNGNEKVRKVSVRDRICSKHSAEMGDLKPAICLGNHNTADMSY